MPNQDPGRGDRNAQVILPGQGQAPDKAYNMRFRSDNPNMTDVEMLSKQVGSRYPKPSTINPKP